MATGRRSNDDQLESLAILGVKAGVFVAKDEMISSKNIEVIGSKDPQRVREIVQNFLEREDERSNPDGILQILEETFMGRSHVLDAFERLAKRTPQEKDEG